MYENTQEKKSLHFDRLTISQEQNLDIRNKIHIILKCNSFTTYQQQKRKKEKINNKKAFIMSIHVDTANRYNNFHSKNYICATY